MSSLATTVVANQLKKAIPGTNDAKFEKIDWNNFNYPPYINVFHYDISHIKEDEKTLVKRLNFFFIGQFLFFVLNFLNAIFQTASGYSWTRMLSSFFWYLIVTGLAGFGFYNAFRAFCGDTSNVMTKFKISWGVLFVFFMFQFFADSICWNSIVRWIRLFQNGHAFAGIFSLLEWLLMLANIAAMIILVLKVRSSNYWSQ